MPCNITENITGKSIEFLVNIPQIDYQPFIELHDQEWAQEGGGNNFWNMFVLDSEGKCRMQPWVKENKQGERKFDNRMFLMEQAQIDPREIIEHE